MGQPVDGIEKRKYPRRSFEAKVGVMIQGKYFVENAFELGERGILFETEIALKNNDNLLISFVIPGGYVVMTRAQVRYCLNKGNKLRVGVEFINITFEDRRKVRDFIAQRNDSAQEQKFYTLQIKK